MSDQIESVLNSLREILKDGKEINVTEVPFINFKGDIAGKGLIWTGQGKPKQLIYIKDQDRFYVSENLDLAKGRSFSVNNINVLNENELGPTVTKSNLTQVGILKGLLVEGNATLNNQFFFVQQKLGIGIADPAGTLHLKDSVDLTITDGSIKAAQDPLNLISNTTKISLTPTGNIQLGDTSQPPVQINAHGKVSIKVKNPDPDVDLHVAGSVKFGNKLQKVDRSYPTVGSYSAGDIVWNSEPRINQYVGWVCVQSGNPGLWEPFGKIGNS